MLWEFNVEGEIVFQQVTAVLCYGGPDADMQAVAADWEIGQVDRINATKPLRGVYWCGLSRSMDVKG